MQKLIFGKFSCTEFDIKQVNVQKRDTKLAKLHEQQRQMKIGPTILELRHNAIKLSPRRSNFFNSFLIISMT